MKLCLSVGYERATVEMIADEAGVSARTFSRYFASKDAAFLAVMDPVADDLVLEISNQSGSVSPLEAIRVAHVAVFTRIAERPHGCPSVDQAAAMLQVVNSSETLRKKGIEYRNPQVMQILAGRMGVGPNDRKLQLAVALFSVTLAGACANLVADTKPELLGPHLVVERMEEAPWTASAPTTSRVCADITDLPARETTASILRPSTGSWRRMSMPRQEHQVGRVLGVFEERLARRAHLRTHRQTAAKVEHLARASGYRKVRRDFSRADRVPDTALH